MLVEGLVQDIVDNFDAELSSPNELVSTHELATIETHSKPPTGKVPDTIAHITKTNMTNSICFEEDDDIILYNSTEKPLPPFLPPHDLPDGICSYITQNSVFLYVFKIFNDLNMNFGLVIDLRLQNQP